MRFEDLTDVETANRTIFGNGAVSNPERQGGARVPAPHRRHGRHQRACPPLAYFPFGGWDYSFFGDLHLQGREGSCSNALNHHTRWFKHGEGDIWHKE
jgi:malonate-semialdehyde dehydrogenase (acetylating)/methylmalonate-semialdehyde dehydrogenase